MQNFKVSLPKEELKILLFGFLQLLLMRFLAPKEPGYIPTVQDLSREIEEDNCFTISFSTNGTIEPHDVSSN